MDGWVMSTVYRSMETGRQAETSTVTPLSLSKSKPVGARHSNNLAGNVGHVTFLYAILSAFLILSRETVQGVSIIED